MTRYPFQRGLHPLLILPFLGDSMNRYSPLSPPEVAGSSVNANDLSRDIPNVVEPSFPKDPSHTTDIPTRLPPLWARGTWKNLRFGAFLLIGILMVVLIALIVYRIVLQLANFNIQIMH